MSEIRLRSLVEQSVEVIVENTPEIVHYLRCKIHDKPLVDENGGGSAGKQESKPPMNLGILDSADREVAVLAKWCDYYGITPNGRTYRVGGEVRGVVEASRGVVSKMAADFLAQLERSTFKPEGMWDDFWAARRSTFNQHSDLKRRYLYYPAEEAIIAEYAAWYAEQEPVEQEGLFDVS